MFYDSITLLEGSEIDNLVVAAGNVFPSAADQGELFFRADTLKLYVYTGSAWLETSGAGSTSGAVTTVAGRTGDVVLSASDVSGLAAVATTGAYSSLTGKPTLATVATTGDYNDLSNKPSASSYTLPVATASVLGGVKQGSGNTIAGDGTLSINFPSNSATASALQTARTISITGDATGNTSFNGSANVSIEIDLANTGAVAGTYTKLTIDAKGRVTNGVALQNSDVVSSLGYTPENTSGKNAANGYAGLDSTGKLASSQLPALAITDTFVVASQSEMVGLTDAEVGDIAVRTDINKTFILKAAGYAVLSNWQELLSPSSAADAITLSGDISGTGTGSITTTLATVNGTIGTFGSASVVPTITVDGKGRVTSVTTNTITAAAGTLTGSVLASGVTSSSLTSVGTLASLTVTGAITTGGLTVGYKEIPQNAQSTYTLVLADSGKHIYNSTGAAATYTIPANSSVAYPVGTTIMFINPVGAAAVTISITTDTLIFAGTGTTGSRSLAAAGLATAIKITSTSWIISGVNLT